MTDYGYANARLRAMRTRLFGPAALQELVAVDRLDELIARLSQSPYEEDIHWALGRYFGPRVVMEACRLHLARVFSQVRDFVEGDGARLVGVLLARWDLANLKAILRGQVAGTPPDEILVALVPVGSLDESALSALVRQPDPGATADALRVWDSALAGMVRVALAAWRAQQNWTAAETALDRQFYAALLARLRPGQTDDDMARAVLTREIDAANALTALRLRRGGERWTEASGQWFLPGGALSAAWLAELAQTARPEEALDGLRETAFGPALARVETLHLATVQRALDLDHAAFGVSFFRRDPLSIAPVIAYLTAKTVEVQNVRLVAQGVALGLSRGDIERDLVMVE